MDGRTLMEIMQSPNFAMWGPAEQAFNTTQEKAKADLATTLGLEQRNQAMHPVELAGKTAVTRLNNSTAAMNEDTLAAQIPALQRQKQKLQESLSKMDDISRAQMKAQVVRNMQLAAMMEKNGGQLPQGFNLSPEEMQIFQPKNLKNIIAHGQAFLEMDPEEISKRQRAAEAEALAKTQAQGRVDLKKIPSAGGGKNNPTMAPPKMNLQQQYGFYNNLAFAEQDPEKKKSYQAEADRIELMILRQAVNAQQARQAGDPNLADPRLGGLPVNPMPNPQPTPRAGGWTPPPGWKVD